MSDGQFVFETNIEAVRSTIERNLSQLSNELSKGLGTANTPAASDFLTKLNRDIAQVTEQGAKKLQDLAQAFGNAQRQAAATGQPVAPPGGKSFSTQAEAIAREQAALLERTVSDALGAAPKELKSKVGAIRDLARDSTAEMFNAFQTVFNEAKGLINDLARNLGQQIAVPQAVQPFDRVFAQTDQNLSSIKPTTPAAAGLRDRNKQKEIDAAEEARLRPEREAAELAEREAQVLAEQVRRGQILSDLIQQRIAREELALKRNRIEADILTGQNQTRKISDRFAQQGQDFFDRKTGAQVQDPTRLNNLRDAANRLDARAERTDASAAQKRLDERQLALQTQRVAQLEADLQAGKGRRLSATTAERNGQLLSRITGEELTGTRQVTDAKIALARVKDRERAEAERAAQQEQRTTETAEQQRVRQQQLYEKLFAQVDAAAAAAADLARAERLLAEEAAGRAKRITAGVSQVGNQFFDRKNGQEITAQNDPTRLNEAKRRAADLERAAQERLGAQMAAEREGRTADARARSAAASRERQEQERTGSFLAAQIEERTTQQRSDRAAAARVLREQTALAEEISREIIQRRAQQAGTPNATGLAANRFDRQGNRDPLGDVARIDGQLVDVQRNRVLDANQAAKFERDIVAADQKIIEAATAELRARQESAAQQQQLAALAAQLRAGTARRTSVAGGAVVTDRNEVFSSTSGKRIDPNTPAYVTAIQARDRAVKREADAAQRAADAAEKRAAAAAAGQNNGVVGSFLGGLSSRGFGGGGQGFDINGLAASAGTLVKYQALSAGLGLVTTGVAALKKEYFDFIDSQTAFNAAFEKGSTATQGFLTTLTSFSREVGSNVGEALDTATRGVAAFSDKTKDSTDAQLANGAAVASAASQLRIVTGKTLGDATGDLIAIATAYGKTADELKQINDAVVNAGRNSGGDKGQISQGLANFAVTAKEAGFGLNEAANLIGLTIAKVDESGQAAGTRLTKIFAIIGGSEGQNAIAALNNLVSPDQEVDTTAPIKRQIEQLAVAYQQLGKDGNTSAQARLRQQLGGTAQIRELLPLLNNQDQLQRANEASAKGAGNAQDEYQKRLKDITGVVRQLGGDLKALAVDFANTGVFDILGIALKLLEPILRTIDDLLQEFNGIGGKTGSTVRNITFTVLELVAAYKLLGAATRAGALGQGFAASGLGSRVAGRGFTQSGVAAQAITSSAALERTGGVATPAIARLQAAEKALEVSLQEVATAVKLQATSTATAAEALVTAEADFIAAVAQGGPAVAAAEAQLVAAQAAYAAEVEAGAALVAEAQVGVISKQVAVSAASTSAAASAGAVAKVIEKSAVEIAKATNKETAIRERVAAQVAEATQAELAARTEGAAALAEAEAKRVGVETAGAAEIAAAVGERVLVEEAAAAKIAAAGAGDAAGAGVGRQLGSARLGPIGIGGAIAIGVASAVKNSFEKIIGSSDKINSLIGKGTTGKNADELNSQASDLRAAAKEARSASSGVIGTITNFLGGNTTGRAADTAEAQAQALEKAAKSLEQLRTEQARGKNAERAIDFSSVDALDKSFKKITESGHTAQEQFDALRKALDNVAKSAGGATGALDQGNSITLANTLGLDVATGIRNTAGLLGQQGNQIPFSRNQNEKDRDVLNKANFSGITDQINNLLADSIRANGGKLPGDKASRKQLQSAIEDIVRGNIPDFAQLSKDAQENVLRGASVQLPLSAKALDSNFGVDQKKAAAAAAAASKQAEADAKARVDSAKRALDNADDPKAFARAQQSLTAAQAAYTKIRAEGAKKATAAAAKNQAIADDVAAEAIKLLEGKAQEAATDAGLKASLRGTAGGGGLAQAKQLFADLAAARDSVLSADPNADVIELQREINQAALGVQSATEAHLQALLQLQISNLSPFDKSGRIKATLKGIDAQLAVETDADKILALQAQKNDETASQTQQKLADDAAKRSAGAQGKGQAAQAAVTVRNAKARLDAIKASGVTSGEDYFKALEDYHASLHNLAVAKLAEANTIATSKIDPRDAVALAKQALKNDTAALAELKKNTPNDKAAIAAAAARVRDDRLAQARAQNDVANAKIQGNENPLSTVSVATGNLQIAKNNLKLTLKGTKEYYDALRAVNDAQRALADAQVEAAKVAAQLTIDLTDPVAKAKQDLANARAKLARDTKAKQPADVINKDKVDVVNAEASADQAAFQQRLSDAQIADQLGRTSHAAYLAYLSGERTRLRQRLAGMKVTDQQYRQTLDELNTIESALKSAQDALQGQFNLGDIKVPTVFEVRRAIAARTGGDATAVQSVNTATTPGFASSQTNVTPDALQVALLRAQLASLTGGAGTTATTAPAGSVVNNTTNSVTINGADFQAVIAYIQSILGPSAARTATTGRKV